MSFTSSFLIAGGNNTNEQGLPITSANGVYFSNVPKTWLLPTGCIQFPGESCCESACLHLQNVLINHLHDVQGKEIWSKSCKIAVILITYSWTQEQNNKSRMWTNSNKCLWDACVGEKDKAALPIHIYSCTEHVNVITIVTIQNKSF